MLDCHISVVANDLSPKHWVVYDGVNPEMVFAKSVRLVENTGRDPMTGNVRFFGHRIYGAMSYLVNSKWIYFLDEDNRISADFAKILEPLTKKYKDAPAITFRRSIHNMQGDLMGYDDFESVPEHFFADTGCVLWNTRFYAEYIAPKMSFAHHSHDRKAYIELYKLTNGDIPHTKAYLLEYTASERMYDFFNRNITKKQ